MLFQIRTGLFSLGDLRSCQLRLGQDRPGFVRLVVFRPCCDRLGRLDHVTSFMDRFCHVRPGYIRFVQCMSGYVWLSKVRTS